MAQATPHSEHNVRYDATNLGQRRLTCWTCNPGVGVMVVDWPALSQSQFEQKALQFLEEHPPEDGMVPCDDHGPAKSLDQLKVWLR